VLHPDTRHAAHETVGTRKKGAHNPNGASNPEHGAARTTKGVRPIGEHVRKGASPRNPTRRLRESGQSGESGPQPNWCVEPDKRGGAHNQRCAHDRGARPKRCFTQQPDTTHERKWALRKKGRTTQRVRQTRNTGRRAQPKAGGRQGSTTQIGASPRSPTRRTRTSGRTTKGVRTTGEHDRKGASPRNPTRRTRESGH